MSSIALYKRTEVIGRGKFGVVYKGHNKQTKQTVAIKVLNLDTQDDEVLDVQQEIQFLTELKNVPNVTHYYGSFLSDTKLWIIMDYCAGGSLRTLLKPGVFEERYIGVIMRELLIALSAVHKLGVIHRDIKAANVLITKEGNVQLCDFGVATKITLNALKRSTMAGTPYWMAPEVIREGDTYNSKADIWSLGITMYEIATGNPPYCEKDAMYAMQLISKSTPPRLEGREHSPSLKECIALCLDENPDERLSADDLLKCKLVRLYKSHPKLSLKELVSRYLLWRDSNSSRDSVFIHLDDEIVNQNNEDGESQKLQVKWDFDSLSSREYVIENDIELDPSEDEYDDSADTYHTLPTFRQTASTTNSYNNSNNNTLHNKSATTAPEIPKSLQMLFEGADEQPQGTFEYNPNISSAQQPDRMESPSIEIPDMDNFSSFQANHPPLNKPPALYHSQSASGNLESRFSGNRPRKKTISNTLSSVNTTSTNSSNTLTGHSSVNTLTNHSNVDTLTNHSTTTTTHSNAVIPPQTAPTPHTPPYNNGNLKTPSPKPPSSALLAAAQGLSLSTSSPSKSMKALQTTTNPLLQPINFKIDDSKDKPKKARPGFHIQMPTPSTLASLSALTNEEFADSENVNQFGINPSLLANALMSMTPVTEKEQLFDEADITAAENLRIAENTRAADLLLLPPAQNQRYYNSVKKTGALLNRSGNSTTNVLAMTTPTIPKFPMIPQINGDFFIDSTPKVKLVSELDNMIRLFNQGLVALENNL